MPKIFDLLLETAKQQEDAAIKNKMKQNEDPKLRQIKDRALMTIIYKILESKK